MPSATKTPPVEEVTKEQQAALARERAKEPKKYVVLVGCITVSTGRKNDEGKQEVVRIMQGGTLEAPPSHPTVRRLLRMRSIAEVAEGEQRPIVTARIIAAAMGAPDDPVEVPKEAVLPMAAPLGGVVADTI